MKIKVGAVVKAILILIFLTVLPVVGRTWLPSEFLGSFSLQGGINLIDLFSRVAVIGLALSVLVLLKGHVERASLGYLLLSIVWKVFCLVFFFFILGLGRPETFGLVILRGIAGQSENVVIFNFRLFAVLATVMVVLMIVHSILQFQEARHAS
ncbi:MAG: hypothetical protein QXN87_05700 [Candidatus Bathyarchaeia archaeon]